MISAEGEQGKKGEEAQNGGLPVSGLSRTSRKKRTIGEDRWDNTRLKMVTRNQEIWKEEMGE